ncbi:signal peptidase II [Paenibacillus chartarius]|uniref:Lipoprotein signal peptidase n=1 Tax=Paenibacillus chartarius TaxID=747481 RepID=A0ABV6DGD8_9BACL
MLFYATSLIAVAVDLITKRLIALHVPVGASMPFWEPYIQFYHYQNSGAARGLFPGYGRYMAVFAIIFVVAVLYYRRKGHLRGFLQEFGTGLLVAGAVGNGIERALFGKVTDFLVFGSGSGILNIADLFINAGTLLTLAGMLVEHRRDRRGRTKAAETFYR